MEPKVIEQLSRQLHTAHKEIKVLYELSEAESVLLTHLIMELPFGSLSPKLVGKLLRAAAHYLESADEIAEKMFKENK